MHTRIVSPLLLLAALAGCRSDLDPGRVPAPTAERLLDEHLHATGGRRAHARIHGRTFRGRAELRGFPDHDWTATWLRREAAPGFWSETLTFGDWTNEEGTDGALAWGWGHVKYPRLEQRLKSLPEQADLEHLVAFHGHLDWRERYVEVEHVGARVVAGRSCHEIVLTPARGQPVSWFLDAESSLLVQTTARLRDTVIETLFEDYRAVDGVQVAHRQVRRMWGGGPGTSTPFLRPGLGKQDLLLVADSVEHDLDGHGVHRDPPASIQALVDPRSNHLPARMTLELAPDVRLELVRIPAGTFRMGTHHPDVGPPFEARIPRSFYLGATEVTNAQLRVWRPGFDSNDPRGGANIPYQQYIKSLNPDLDGPDQPAVYVSWEEALAFTEWLGDRVGRTVRLPTDAEWEYACRAGTTTRFSWGDEEDLAHEFANTNDPVTAEVFRLGGPFPRDDGHRATAPVGSFRPNAWGLFDMHGNVAEWTADRWPLGPEGEAGETGQRVVRGGSFEASPTGREYFDCGSAARSWNWLHNRNFGTGFRVLVEVAERSGR